MTSKAALHNSGAVSEGRLAMKTVNIHETTLTLSELLTEVEQGEDVVLARDGTPVARLTRVKTFNRQPGIAAVPGWTYDPAIFAPLTTDEELAAEGWPV